MVLSHHPLIMSGGILIRRVGFERICAIFCRLLKGKDVMLISNNDRQFTSFIEMLHNIENANYE